MTIKRIQLQILQRQRYQLQLFSDSDISAAVAKLLLLLLTLPLNCRWILWRCCCCCCCRKIAAVALLPLLLCVSRMQESKRRGRINLLGSAMRDAHQLQQNYRPCYAKARMERSRQRDQKREQQWWSGQQEANLKNRKFVRGRR